MQRIYIHKMVSREQCCNLRREGYVLVLVDRDKNSNANNMHVPHLHLSALTSMCMYQPPNSLYYSLECRMLQYIH